MLNTKLESYLPRSWLQICRLGWKRIPIVYQMCTFNCTPFWAIIIESTSMGTMKRMHSQFISRILCPHNSIYKWTFKFIKCIHFKGQSWVQIRYVKFYNIITNLRIKWDDFFSKKLLFSCKVRSSFKVAITF